MKLTSSFVAITTEGGLLPADFLVELLSSKADIEGLTPTSYNLADGERISEQVNRSWNRLKGRWADFKKAMAVKSGHEFTTTETRNRWLQPLFQELGYGQRLTRAKPIEIDGKSYPVSHACNHVPMHLVGAHIDLDQRTSGVVGAAKASPHSLLQQLLNASDEHLWGIASNGLNLRLLRDNIALTRQALVEWDLAAIFDGDLYSEFFLLWLVIHQSRFDAERPEQCWLEQWRKKAEDKGLRALDRLRLGVTCAIEALGAGLLLHPQNKTLQSKLRTGKLTPQDFYRQVLRIIYRILFLLVAEDRELLHAPLPHDRDTDTFNRAIRVRQRYRDFYSVGRLRILTLARAGTPHTDLWQTFQFISEKLGSNEGCPELALPALGSFLWDTSRSTQDLNDALISNYHLITAVHALAFLQDGSTRRFVDYKNLGSEELGSVYEGLLELYPTIDTDMGAFQLSVVTGSERKMSGSYYTPDSLVQCLLDSALEPVIADAVRGKQGQSAVNAVLNLKVCDPAAGSGHFLIAAAHRLARHVAAARSAEDEPSPMATRTALRDVIGRCIFGVDINPMAVELCKVSLWMEAVDPGKPLSFLDHHIQCGNSLFGTTPTLMRNGIPDEAFKPIEGDDAKVCSEYRKQNKREHQQETLLGFYGERWEHLGNFATNILQIASLPDDRLEDVRAKEQKYAALLLSTGYKYAHHVADAWCATFVWFKRQPTADEPDYPITNEVFRRIERNPYDTPHWMHEEIQRLAAQYQFFHWHLAFPDVFQVPLTDQAENEVSGWTGGFDVILGNPPWEQIQVEAHQFFESRKPELLKMKRSDRAVAIEKLENTEPALFQTWQAQRRLDLSTTAFLKSSARYPLSTQKNVNTYAVFQELAMTLLSRWGRSGLVLQSGIATDEIIKPLFQALINRRRLVCLYDFENRQRLFRDIDSRLKFCLITTTGVDSETREADFVFFAEAPENLAEQDRHFSLTDQEITLLNPNTRTCPIFRSKQAARLCLEIFDRIPILLKEVDPKHNAWRVSIRRMFDMTYDSRLFKTKTQLITDGIDPQMENSQQWLRLYEAKFIHQFDHRFATFTAGIGEGETDFIPAELKRSPDVSLVPRYWIRDFDYLSKMEGTGWNHNWIIIFRMITNTTNERTAISAIVPRCGVGNSCYTITFDRASPQALACFLCNLNSFCFDWTTRQKLAGTNLNVFILKQLPVLPPAAYDRPCTWTVEGQTVQAWLLPRILELSYTAWDLQAFAQDCGWTGPPFHWDEERRFLLRCELDAAFFHLYGLNRVDTAYILDAFPIVQRKDEEKHNGDYRTKRVILEIYDEITNAISTRLPYRTRLDPAPADIQISHRPSYCSLPLHLPQNLRFPQADQNVYAMRIIMTMLNLSANKIEMATLMNACWLLAKPERLGAVTRDVEQDMIAAWSRSFSDTFDPNLFLPTIDELVHRGELNLEREGQKFIVNRVGTMHIVTDPYIEFDALLALRVESSLTETERQSILPMASSQELEVRFKVA